MTPIPSCPQCGAPLPSEGWEGLCPKCLVRVSLEAGAESGLAEPLRRFGDYELLEEIARGGMGVVYKARQVSLNRTVAVKMILAGQLASAAEVQRFRAEAEAAANLNHPNIVAIHEIGQQEGQHFFSMDYVEGQNLAEFVGQNALPPKQAAQYLKTVAEAIQCAHERGILHRDLKPSNILIDQSGQPRITDFGLAKRMKGDSDLTISGQVLGSPNFMPPEQAAGKRTQIGPHSDIYALGAILFYLVTARPPFAAESMTETLQLVVNTEPPSPRLLNPSVPRDLETICLKCLSKEPERRYGSAQELAEDLERFLKGESVRARPVGAGGKAWRWCRRNPVIASFAGATTVLLLAVAIGSPIAALRINGAKKLAQSNATESRTRLVRQYVANGNRLVEDGDLFGALPWFAQALNEEKDNPERAELHRLRIGTTLQQCPKLAQLWFHKDAIRWLTFSPDGRWLGTVANDRTAQVWDAATGQPVSISLKHDGPVVIIKFSPDGHLVATGGLDSKVGVWDVKTSRLLYPFLKHGGSVARLDFSPDGRFLVTGCWDWTAQLWDVATGARVGPPLKHDAPVGEVCFSPDGNRILVVAGTSAVIWRVPTGEQVMRLKIGETTAGFGEFSTNGRRVAITGRDGTAWVFDAESGERIISVRHRGPVNHARFSPDNRWLLTASNDGTAWLWDAATGMPVSPPVRHSEPVFDALFSPDGRTFVTASIDGTAGLWNTATGKPVTARLKHAEGPIWALFSPDGQRLVTAGEADHGARLWDLRGVGQPYLTLTYPAVVQRASFSPDSRRVLAISIDGTAHVWELATGQVLSAIEPSLVAVRHAQFSPDGSRLATASTNGTARVWDLGTGRALSPPLMHTGLVNFVDFSPDGNMVVTAGSDRFARVWELPSGRLVSQMSHRESVNYAWFTADAKKVVTINVSVPEFFQGVGWGGVYDPKMASCLTDRQAVSAAWAQAQSWDVATGKPDGPPRRLGTSVSQAAISPDRSRVVPACFAIGLAEKQVGTMDLRTGQQSSAPFRHDNGIIHASFSPNGKCAVTASWDRTARVWNVATGRPLGPSLKHGGPVYHASFSPDSRLVVTASGDQTARVWDFVTGEPVTPPLKHNAAVHRALFSPDGRWVLTTSVDGTVRVWELRPSSQPAEAELARAQLLAAHYIDATGALSAVGPEGMQKLWQEWQQRASAEDQGAPRSVDSLPKDGAAGGGELPAPAPDAQDEVSHRDRLVYLAWLNAHKSLFGPSTLSSNDLAEIVEQLSRAINTSPDGDAASGSYRDRGHAYELLGQYQQAVDDYREMLWRMNSEIPDKTRLGTDYLRRGEFYARLGENEKAEADVQKALEYYSDNGGRAEQYSDVAWLYATGPTNFRSVEKALPLALKAVQLDKSGQGTLNTLGVVYYRLGQFTNSVEVFERDSKNPAPLTIAYDQLFEAMSYQRLGESAKAQSCYDKAVKWLDENAASLPSETRQELNEFRAEADQLLGKRVRK